jgi:deoxyribodipyrimidine photolyase-like uncharacterized protein
MDALFWSFIDKNRDFLLKNYRSALLVSTWDRMPEDKRNKLRDVAETFWEKWTHMKREKTKKNQIDYRTLKFHLSKQP